VSSKQQRKPIVQQQKKTQVQEKAKNGDDDNDSNDIVDTANDTNTGFEEEEDDEIVGFQTQRVGSTDSLARIAYSYSNSGSTCLRSGSRGIGSVTNTRRQSPRNGNVHATNKSGSVDPSSSILNEEFMDRKLNDPISRISSTTIISGTSKNKVTPQEFANLALMSTKDNRSENTNVENPSSCSVRTVLDDVNTTVNNSITTSQSRKRSHSSNALSKIVSSTSQQSVRSDIVNADDNCNNNNKNANAISRRSASLEKDKTKKPNEEYEWVLRKTPAQVEAELIAECHETRKKPRAARPQKSFKI
jgi:hypothetical protein